MEGLFVLLATQRCLHMIVQEETKSVFFLPNIELNNSIGLRPAPKVKLVSSINTIKDPQWYMVQGRSFILFTKKDK